MPEAPTIDATRVKILDAAEQQFRQFGYQKTTTTDIAKACRMSPANLYRFFASKSAIMEDLCTRLLGEAGNVLETIAFDGTPAEQRLIRVVEYVHWYTCERILDSSQMNDMVTAAMQENWTAISKHLFRIRSLITKIIRDGIDEGAFPAQDTDLAAACFHAGFIKWGHPILVAQTEKAGVPTPSARQIATFLIGGLKQGLTER